MHSRNMVKFKPMHGSLNIVLCDKGQVTLDNSVILTMSFTTLSRIGPFSCHIGLASCIPCCSGDYCK